MKNNKNFNLKGKRDRNKRERIEGVVTIYVISSFNNTILTAAKVGGSPIATASGGSAGFKNTRESTPFAAQSAAELLCEKLKEFKIGDVIVVMKGMGPGREAALKTISNQFSVIEIQDATPVMHNGTRLPKRRRS